MLILNGFKKNQAALENTFYGFSSVKCAISGILSVSRRKQSAIFLNRLVD